MADVELIIKIPQKVYKAICDKNALGCDISDVKNIIRNGIPLEQIRNEIKGAYDCGYNCGYADALND